MSLGRFSLSLHLCVANMNLCYSSDAESHGRASAENSRMTKSLLPLATLFLLVSSVGSWAASEKVLHVFTGGNDGSNRLVRVEKDGAVREVLLYATTKVGKRLCETMLKDTLLPPPTPAHWVDVFPPGAWFFLRCRLSNCTSPRDRSPLNSPRQFSVRFLRVAWLRTDSNANRLGFRRLLKRSRRVRLRLRIERSDWQRRAFSRCAN